RMQYQRHAIAAIPPSAHLISSRPDTSAERALGHWASPVKAPKMDARDAVALIEPAVRGAHATPGTWADLGAGSGTFTRALVEILGASSRVYAVDRDASAVKVLRQWSARDAPNVVAVQADITKPFDLPDKELDG